MTSNKREQVASFPKNNITLYIDDFKYELLQHIKTIDKKSSPLSINKSSKIKDTIFTRQQHIF